MDNIFITKENLSSILIYPDQIFLFKYSASSAMGSPGEIVIVLTDGTVYTGNYEYGDLEEKDFYRFLPMLSSITNANGPDFRLIEDQWKLIYLGMHNYLLVRLDYYDDYLKKLESIADEKDIQTNFLSRNWYSVAMDFIKERG